MNAHELTGMYELLDAIESVVKAADPVKREALARTMTWPSAISPIGR
jgi:hypothetical protein